LVEKPAGMTSFDVVSKCRRIFHEKKIGHTGTLDPNAGGLMIVLLGKYTKLVPYAVKDHKVYHAHFSFGKKTDTEDVWGTVTDEKAVSAHTQAELDEACARFTGKILQIPPMYSALKVNGKKLYELARKGKEIEREPREVEVFSLSVYENGDNDFIMDASVSSGTYIRTLITDFANALGEYACMTSLERRSIEGLSLNDAVKLEDLNENTPGISPLSVIDPKYPVVVTDREKDIRNGKKIRIDSDGDVVILVNEKNELLAAYEKREDGYYHSLRGLF